MKRIRMGNGISDVKFNKGEQFKLIEGLYHQYFISSFGNVIRLDSNGYFKVCNNFICPRSGKLQVWVKTKGGSKHNVAGYPIMVARLVLQYFIGGYYRQRDLIHKDGNLMNCRLDNLLWKYGFLNGIDYDYLESLDDERLNKDHFLIKKYLLTKKIKYINSFMNKSKGIFYWVYHTEKDGERRDFNDWYNEAKIYLKQKLDSGLVRPHYDGHKYFIDNPVNLMKGYFRLAADESIRQKIKNKKTRSEMGQDKYIDLLSLSDRKHNGVIRSENVTIEQEVNELFESLSCV